MIGLLGRKRGMTAIFDDKGDHTPVTVLTVGPCTVLEVKTKEKHSYDALRLAFEPRLERKMIKPDIGQFKKAGIETAGVVREIRDFKGDFHQGSVLTVGLFAKGDRVLIIGTSKGKGTAGVVKRHNFGRANQTHGTHEAFRGPGSIGAHSFPARTWPGQRMAGRMGNAKVTRHNVRVVEVDVEKGLLLVKGAVPGAIGGLISILKAG